MTDPILAKLNDAQKQAVTWGNTPLLVLAGAGSGKTRILTHRIAYQILNGVPAFNILAVTFTNKAAGEMKNRIQKLVQNTVWVSTFHATCLRILRIDGPTIGIDRNFTIYDEHDQLVLIKECIKELNLNEKQVHPKGVRERIQSSKDYLITAYQYAERAAEYYEEAIAKIYRLYEEKMERLKALDFGDLIMKTVSVFDRHPNILNTWQDRFQHVLIDEYQDTNHAQYRLVKLLAAKTRQVTVVGDPDQSIYAWRGADIKNILNFEQDYPECKTIKMEQNYRSTQLILDAANELINRNQMRKPKALWSERSGGERISLFEARDEKDEAWYVADRVLKNVQAGKTLNDQVIFYRVHAQSRIIEDMLRRAKIPYKIVGGTRFYDRKEIKDIVAYLRAVAFPHDDVSLKRILNVPARGIGKKAVESLEALQQSKSEEKISFDQVIRHAGSLEGVTPKGRKALESFSRFLDKLRGDYQQMPLLDLVEFILSHSGYLRELEAEKTVEAQARIENIEEFFSVIEDFEEGYRSAPPSEIRDEAGKPDSHLHAFLESISLMSDLDTWEGSTNVLTLMTLHTAKGLEFPIAYMVGMEEGIFPNMNSFTDTLDDLEEERRLCYVGITRAKDKLHMSYARQRRLYGTQQFNLPSRFLNEIPHRLFDQAHDPAQLEAAIEDAIDDDIIIDVDQDEKKRRILFD